MHDVDSLKQLKIPARQTRPPIKILSKSVLRAQEIKSFWQDTEQPEERIRVYKLIAI